MKGDKKYFAFNFAKDFFKTSSMLANNYGFSKTYICSNTSAYRQLQTQAHVSPTIQTCTHAHTQLTHSLRIMFFSLASQPLSRQAIILDTNVSQRLNPFITQILPTLSSRITLCISTLTCHTDHLHIN